MEFKFDLSDVVLVPADQSRINSRSECDVYTKEGTLPLLASPMDTVVDNNNIVTFSNCRIKPCIPRGQHDDVMLFNDYYFKSYSLSEIEEQLEYYHSNKTGEQHNIKKLFFTHRYVLIDIANGHMIKLTDTVKKIKSLFPEIRLMVGNVANPQTYKVLSEAGADYVRCSVGTGAGCTTAANVSINYPLGSLISECKWLKHVYHLNAKIVADGGMRNYSDIIKALALGADYVMIGSLFNKAIESAGFNYIYGIKINNKIANTLWKWGWPIKKKYRGMSTKAVQRSWGKTKLKTAEGITKYQNVEYTICQWTENFTDYLRSAMSYCDAKNLDEFIGKAKVVQITHAAYERFKK